MFRFSEIVALVSLSTTFFLFIHTRDLNIRLAENAQFEASASGLASAIGQGESSLNKDRRIEAERLADLELYGKVKNFVDFVMVKVFLKKRKIWSVSILFVMIVRLTIWNCPVILWIVSFLWFYINLNEYIDVFYTMINLYEMEPS